MKTLISIILIVFFSFSFSNPIKDGKLKGIKLYGKVRITDRNPTFRVKLIQSTQFANLRVVLLPALQNPNQVGQWQLVNYGEDFSIQFDDLNYDFSIRFVEYNPGVE